MIQPKNIHDKRRDVDFVSMEKSGLEKTGFTKKETLIILLKKANACLFLYNKISLKISMVMKGL